MKETVRISDLFKQLYNGEPWIDITLAGILNGLSADEAARKVYPDSNTIWEITNHIIKWRFNVLERIYGTENYPAGHETNYFAPVEDPSEKAWKDTLKMLEQSQTNWMEALKDLDEKRLEEINPRNKMSLYSYIHGIIQHDAYHLGQIVILMKGLK